MLITLSIRNEESVDTLCGHVLGVSKLMDSLPSNPFVISGLEWQWFGGLWLEFLAGLYRRLRDRYLFQDLQLYTIELKRVCKMLDTFHAFPTASTDPLSSSNMLLLSVKIDFYLTYYLLISEDDGSESEIREISNVSDALAPLLKQFIELLPLYHSFDREVLPITIDGKSDYPTFQVFPGVQNRLKFDSLVSCLVALLALSLISPEKEIDRFSGHSLATSIRQTVFSAGMVYPSTPNCVMDGLALARLALQSSGHVAGIINK